MKRKRKQKKPRLVKNEWIDKKKDKKKDKFSLKKTNMQLWFKWCIKGVKLLGKGRLHLKYYWIWMILKHLFLFVFIILIEIEIETEIEL